MEKKFFFRGPFSLTKSWPTDCGLPSGYLNPPFVLFFSSLSALLLHSTKQLLPSILPSLLDQTLDRSHFSPSDLPLLSTPPSSSSVPPLPVALTKRAYTGLHAPALTKPASTGLDALALTKPVSTCNAATPKAQRELRLSPWVEKKIFTLGRKENFHAPLSQTIAWPIYSGRPSVYYLNPISGFPILSPSSFFTLLSSPSICPFLIAPFVLFLFSIGDFSLSALPTRQTQQAETPSVPATAAAPACRIYRPPYRPCRPCYQCCLSQAMASLGKRQAEDNDREVKRHESNTAGAAAPAPAGVPTPAQGAPAQTSPEFAWSRDFWVPVQGIFLVFECTEPTPALPPPPPPPPTPAPAAEEGLAGTPQLRPASPPSLAMPVPAHPQALASATGRGGSRQYWVPMAEAGPSDIKGKSRADPMQICSHSPSPSPPPQIWTPTPSPSPPPPAMRPLEPQVSLGLLPC